MLIRSTIASFIPSEIDDFGVVITSDEEKMGINIEVPC